MPGGYGVLADLRPRRTEWLLTLAAIALAAAVIVLAVEMRLAYSVTLLAGMIGLTALVALKGRRVVLVVGWILLHPLSIEKVFFVGAPLYPTFAPQVLVISASDIVLGLLVLALLFEACTAARRVWWWPPLATPLLWLGLWTIVVMMIRGTTVASWLGLLSQAKMLLFIVVLSSCIRTRDELLLVLAAILVAVGLQDLAVVYAYITGRPIQVTSSVVSELMTFSGQTEHARATGTLGHTNQQAAFHAFFTLPLVALIAVANPRWRRMGILVILGSLGAVVLTFSRSSWLALMLAIPVMLVVAFRSGYITRRMWTYLAALGLVACVVVGAFWGPITDRLGRGDEGATKARGELIALADQMIKDHPVTGVGPGNFIQATLELHPFNRQRGVWVKEGEQLPWAVYDLDYAELTVRNNTYMVPSAVHNLYLLIGSELGLVGLLLFLWFQWRVFHAVRECLRLKDRVLWLIGWGVLGAFCATLVYMMLDLFNSDKSVELLYFVPVLAAALSRIGAETPEAEGES